MNESRSVLFVDDEIDVLTSIKKQFRKANFRLRTSNGGNAALDLLSTIPVQVIISDEQMPKMDGIEFFKKVKKLYPDTIRIILSGYADSSVIIDAINKGEVFRFVSKPWEKEQLSEVIELAFSHYSTIQNNKKYMKRIIEENRQLHKDLSRRDFNIEISHEILNLIPIPVLAIAHDETIEFYNEKALTLNSKSINKSDRLNTIFPEDVVGKILKGFKQISGQTSLEWEKEDCTLVILVRTLRLSDSCKGLLIIEEKR